MRYFIIRYLKYLLALLFCLLLSPSQVMALVINEINYDAAGTDTNREWIELYNETDQSIDLTGSYFNDGNSHALSVPPDKGGQGTLIIEPAHYLVLAADAATFLSEYPTVKSSVIDTVMNLPNYSVERKEPITLQILDKTKQPFLSIDYLPTDRGTDGYTLARDQSNQWHDSASAGGTPGAENNFWVPVHYPSGISWSELLLDPEGKDDGQEWVEFFNQSNQSINLKGWRLMAKRSAEDDGTAYSIADDLLVQPSSYARLMLSKSFLKSTTESVELQWPDNQVVEIVTMSGKGKEGQSWAKIENSWQWTDQLTPGQANQLGRPSPVSTPSKPATAQPKVRGLSTTQPKTTITSQVSSPNASRSALSPVPLPSSSITNNKTQPLAQSQAIKQASNVPSKGLTDLLVSSPTASPTNALSLSPIDQLVGQIDLPSRQSRLQTLVLIGMGGFMVIISSLVAIRKYHLIERIAAARIALSSYEINDSPPESVPKTSLIQASAAELSTAEPTIVALKKREANAPEGADKPPYQSKPP